MKYENFFIFFGFKYWLVVTLLVVQILIITILSLYNMFPAIQAGQIMNPDKYRLGELLFIKASFISKITLNVFVLRKQTRIYF